MDTHPVAYKLPTRVIAGWHFAALVSLFYMALQGGQLFSAFVTAA